MKKQGAQNQNVNNNTQFNVHDSEQSSRSFGSLFTPIADHNRRGFIGTNSYKKPRNVVSQEGSNLNEQTSDNLTTQQVLWGTNINLQEINQKIRSFFLNYRDKSLDDSNAQQIYYLKFNEIIETSVNFLNVDGNHIFEHDKELYLRLIYYPSEMIPIMDHVSVSLLEELNPDKTNVLPAIQVRITNLKDKSRIRDLKPEDIDKLISIKGIVIRTTEIIPELREAFFQCTICNREERSNVQRSKIIEPIDCKSCHSKYTFNLIHNRSLYTDKQIIKIQETPDHMPEGETPLTLQVNTYDDLVENVKPGDKCELVGIFRAQGIRLNLKHRTTKSIFRTHVDVVSFTKTSKGRFKELDNEDEDQDEFNKTYSEEIRQQVFSLAQSPDVYQQLIDSFAPSIWENDNVKKGLLLQLFGGVNKDFSKVGRGHFRGDINILLIGDPSTAKSQMLQHVHNLAPRGIYTSGKGSSVVGLTAYVSRDPETKEFVLESGALVLSDRGICCIDEFDKMDDNTRVVLHEAMEQQTISIAKAGIICQLNARTAILASANPIDSKYDPKKSVIANIKLPPTLISRFDLIYLMLDPKSEIYDRRLASHILSLYGDQEELMEIDKKYISKEVMMAYISFAKRHNPELNPDVVNVLIAYYMKMRELGSYKNTISATPRQLESVIRLAEARARLRFSKYVEKEDVDEAVELIKVATQQAATDPVTGVIDMDLINTGVTTQTREKITIIYEQIKIILREFNENARKGIKFQVLLEEVKKKIETGNFKDKSVVTEYDVREALRLLEDEEFLSILGNKKSPIIRLINI